MPPDRSPKLNHITNKQKGVSVALNTCYVRGKIAHHRSSPLAHRLLPAKDGPRSRLVPRPLFRRRLLGIPPAFPVCTVVRVFRFIDPEFTNSQFPGSL